MIAPARRASLDALVQIDEGHLDLGAAVARARATLHDERDRALLLEIVTGTLRMRAADVLHVALLEEINPDLFVTRDKDQHALAVARAFPARLLA